MVNSEEEIKLKSAEIIEAQGAELIDFKIFSLRAKSIVRCIIDYPDGGITMGDCAKINREIFSFLEESNLLGQDYTVEVNSPGLDRLLKTGKDYSRLKGKIVSLWLNERLNGTEYLEGEILATDLNTLRILYKGKALDINFDKIKAGKQKLIFK
jgi:ribosome maturation factor RimP